MTSTTPTLNGTHNNTSPNTPTSPTTSSSLTTPTSASSPATSTSVTSPAAPSPAAPSPTAPGSPAPATWPALVSAALLGTERRTPPVAMRPGQSGAAALLDEAAVSTVRRRAALRPAPAGERP
ncbi:DUF5691 domain-containing protein, partial [Streptomyces kronopolitis]|uniref:DUF5691 domain-containing protein n=1 Tax=Streptomyces kronopolitis TaxID=1612435 RepID=UPI004032CF8F